MEDLVIGLSREGRPLTGCVLGHGPHLATLVAGAHAEEPIGPRTLRRLVQLLRAGEAVEGANGVARPAADILERWTLLIVPDMNPDGAERARAWMPDEGQGEPGAGDFVRRSVREKPGEDVEFGWPFSGEEAVQGSVQQSPWVMGQSVPPLRPENAAAAAFLRREVHAHASRFGRQPEVALHASLHGMAFASGVWWLVGGGWTSGSGARGLESVLADICLKAGFPLFDVDRRGEKGFQRRCVGFSTPPRAEAMADFFLHQTPSDVTEAARFRPSSMDFAQSFGGDPLLLVSEIPLFLIDASTAEQQVRNQMGGDGLALLDAPLNDYGARRLEALRSALRHDGLHMHFQETLAEFDVRAIPVDWAVAAQATFLLQGMALVESRVAAK